MELLSPAGNFEAFLAAVNNGADAVYLGGKLFNARQSAQNFNDEELKRALDYAHVRGKRIYITVNTLLDNEEFNEALEYIFSLQVLGADAIIVQDIGLLDKVRHIFPDLRVHASTQMTVHNLDGLQLMSSLGVKRVVLAREMSWRDLQLLNESKKNVEIEVFVHGAICYSYSGQCLFSSLVGGRSGNRGRCAQPCRLAYQLYDLHTKEKIVPLNKGKYLLSPADLCLIDDLTALKKAGVHSLKIEGRMKRAEYVAVVTRSYREVLDKIDETADFKPREETKNELLRIFNRNFSTGYLKPPYHNFLSTQRPNNRGVYAGRVVGLKNDTLELKLTEPVVTGDGLAVWVKKGKSPALILEKFTVNDKPADKAEPGDIISVNVKGNITLNDRVFKTHDEKLLQAAQQSFMNPAEKIPLKAEINMESAQPVELIFLDNKGHKGKGYSKSPAVEAVKEPLDEVVLQEKIGRLGNTNFRLEQLIRNGSLNLIIPFSELNEMRRSAVEDLMKQIYPDNSVNWETFKNNKDKYLPYKSHEIAKNRPFLSIMVSTAEQARAALENGAQRVYLSLEGMGHKKKISRSEFKHLQELAEKNKAAIIPALPSICRPVDSSLRQEIINWDCPLIMVSNWGDLRWARDSKIHYCCNYNLNVFNQWALAWLLGQGAETVCLSPELTLEQLQKFAALKDAELLIHGELILLQSQFCLLKGLLQEDCEQKCSAFCEAKRYGLSDEKGFLFPLETDRYCRQYIFNSRTLCMIDKMDELLKLSPAGCRIEARRLSPEQIKKTIEVYIEGINGYYTNKKKAIPSDLLKSVLLEHSNSPFTKCHYYRGVL